MCTYIAIALCSKMAAKFPVFSLSLLSRSRLRAESIICRPPSSYGACFGFVCARFCHQFPFSPPVFFFSSFGRSKEPLDGCLFVGRRRRRFQRGELSYGMRVSFFELRERETPSALVSCVCVEYIVQQPHVLYSFFCHQIVGWKEEGGGEVGVFSDWGPTSSSYRSTLDILSRQPPSSSSLFTVNVEPATERERER